MTKVAAIQMTASKVVEENLAIVAELVNKAANQGVQLAVLPENFMTIAMTTEERLAIVEPFSQGPLQQYFAKLAQKTKIWLVGGTLPIASPFPNKPFSTTVVWNANGEIVARYDKIHLFDVAVSENETYFESSYITPGKRIVTVDTPVGKLGLAICYDVRFPEFFRVLMKNKIDIIALPAAFTVPTGKAHWEALLKARAIENLSYLIAAGNVGTRSNGVKTYGHSMIIGPWGEILASLEEGSGVVINEIDLAYLASLRRSFPALSHFQPTVMQALTATEE